MFTEKNPNQNWSGLYFIYQY